MAGLEEHILTLIKNFLTTVGYPGVFLLMAIEGFGIPIPSEITMPFSGFLATAAGGSKFSLPVAIAVGSVGELAGGIVAYFLGYFGGRPILERYGRVVLLHAEELEKAETWFSRYGDWVVLVTRLLPAIRSFIALPAGVVRMPFWRFLLYGAVGTVVWCTVLALIGHALGQHWQTLGNNLRKYDVVILIAVVLLIVFAIYKRLTAGRGEIESEPEQAISADT
jgi:membrane protein DedA with SNARE-associated domain